MNMNRDTHRKTIGYILWLFGFTGSHRFYYGYPLLEGRFEIHARQNRL
jgi:TM2 domain-containing membrane protein YozV